MIINKLWMFQSVANNIVVKIKCVWNWILLGLGASYGILDNVIVRFFFLIIHTILLLIFENKLHFF